jgi:hypothetical protein
MFGPKSWVQRQSGSGGFVPIMVAFTPPALMAQTPSRENFPFHSAARRCLTPSAGPRLPCLITRPHHGQELKEPCPSRQALASLHLRDNRNRAERLASVRSTLLAGSFPKLGAHDFPRRERVPNPKSRTQRDQLLFQGAPLVRPDFKLNSPSRAFDRHRHPDIVVRELPGKRDVAAP